MSNFVVEKVQTRRDLDRLRTIYREVLDASPRVLPARPGDGTLNDIFLAAGSTGRVFGGVTISRANEGFVQIAQTMGREFALKYAYEYPLLSHLAVQPEHQGRGIGSELLRRAITAATAAGGRRLYGFAEVHDGRPSAPFYEEHGFELHPEWSDGFEIGGVAQRSPVERDGVYFSLVVS